MNAEYYISQEIIKAASNSLFAPQMSAYFFDIIFSYVYYAYSHKK